MNGSYDDISLIVLDGATPSQYAPWNSSGGGIVFLPEYVADLGEIEPIISTGNKPFDGYRFEVLFDTPDELRARNGGWTRVAGCIVDAVQASRNGEAATRIRTLLQWVCTSLVNNPVEPWFRIVGFHLVCVVANEAVTPEELAFRDDLVQIIGYYLKIYPAQGPDKYEAASAEAFRRQMVHATSRMVDYQSYWALVGKRVAQPQST